MKYYKLTDQDYKTYGGTQWGESITHKATGTGKALCSGNVIHVYDHPLKATMFNIIHAAFTNPLLWKCKVKRVVANDNLKVGVKECTTLRIISLPVITTNQRVRFAILCALTLPGLPAAWASWANDWLSGKNRTAEAAGVAAGAAEAAGVACAARAAEAAWTAAGVAAGAAEAAALAYAARAAEAAWTAAGVAAGAAEAAALACAARAAEAAWTAAGVAAGAAKAAWEAGIDFVALIKQAIREEKS
jgi:hypothetical protein